MFSSIDVRTRYLKQNNDMKHISVVYGTSMNTFANFNMIFFFWLVN